MSGFPVFSLIILIGCIFGFWFGANWLVDSSVRIARKIGVSELIIGLTIVAIGTSAPEFAVSISSAMQGKLDISVGNIVGSNIFNVGFILGGLAIFRAVSASKKLVYRDGMVVTASVAMLMIFMWDGVLVAWEGGVFLGCLVTYVAYLIYQREPSAEELDDGEFSFSDIPLFIWGCFVVVASGNFFVGSASEIATFFGVSDWVIGVTIVAFGTSAPEIATSAVALMRGHMDISAGNLIGSNIFNTFGVLGLAPFLTDGGRMVVESSAQESTYVLLLLMVVVVVMMRTGWEVSRWEGFLLFWLAGVSWVLNFRAISLFELGEHPGFVMWTVISFLVVISLWRVQPLLAGLLGKGEQVAVQI